MSWGLGNKRMQYQGIGSQVAQAAAGDTRRQSSGYSNQNEISILQGFKDSGCSPGGQTRMRSGVRPQQSNNVLPCHNGGGDTATETHTGRVMKARKSAQMEYKEQLDLQIAQQKLLKEQERQKEFQNVRISPLRGPIVPQIPMASSPPIPIETKPIPAVQCWLIPTSTSPVLLTDKNCPPGQFSPAPIACTSQAAIGRSPAKISQPIPMQPLPIESKSDQSFYRRGRMVPYRGQSEDLQSHLQMARDEEFEANNHPAAVSQSEPQLGSTQLDYEDYQDEYSRSPGQRSHGYAVAEPQQTSRQQWEEMLRNPTYVVTDGSGALPHCAAVPVILNSAEGASVFTPTPPAGTSPCGSVFGDSCHSGDASFGSGTPTNVSFRQHISQTADQRPGTSVRNSAYKCALKQQIQEKRREDEERRRREHEEDERLQQKIQRDQERMQEEYEAEKLRFQQKEDEKRKKEDEALERQKALIKEAEEARQKAMEERRNRLSGAKESTEAQPPSPSPALEVASIGEPRPSSPPIPSLRGDKNPINDIPEYPPENQHTVSVSKKRTSEPRVSVTPKTKVSWLKPKPVVKESSEPKLSVPTVETTKEKVPRSKPKPIAETKPHTKLKHTDVATPQLEKDSKEPPTFSSTETEQESSDTENRNEVPNDPDYRNGNDNVSETLNLLERVRQALQYEIIESQHLFEQQMEELEMYL